MKRLTALLLALTMFFTFMIPAFAAEEVTESTTATEAETTTEAVPQPTTEAPTAPTTTQAPTEPEKPPVDESRLPVIYIIGKQNTPVYKLDENGNFLLDENGKKIQVDNVTKPLGMSRGEYIKTQIEPVMKELVPALVTGEYSAYIDALVEAFAPVYEESVLNHDGVSTTAAIDWDYKVQKPTVGAGNLKYYYFRYDWRYSPYDIADDLHTFVEYVCKKEGVEKVNIHARCYGSNVAMAYIGKCDAGMYDTPYRINNLALNTTPLAGYSVVGALMSGSIKLDSDIVDRFVSLYLNGNDLFDDPMMEATAVILLSLSNQMKILGLGMDVVQQIYDKIAEELVPAIGLVCYGTYPSYWSMVGEKYYDKAIALMFNTPELRSEWSGLITRLNNYHSLIGDLDENGRPLYESLLKRCEANFGMKTCILAKYGFQAIPLYEGSQITGDERGTVTELSLGALGTVIDETFSERELEIIQSMPGYDKRYLSPDKKVYAGSCLFPETTWISKNLQHADLTQIDPIVTEFFLTDGALTVHSDERYPQFFNYENGKFVEVSEENEMEDIWASDILTVLKRFFQLIVDFFKSLFNAE